MSSQSLPTGTSTDCSPKGVRGVHGRFAEMRSSRVDRVRCGVSACRGSQCWCSTVLARPGLEGRASAGGERRTRMASDAERAEGRRRAPGGASPPGSWPRSSTSTAPDRDALSSAKGTRSRKSCPVVARVRPGGTWRLKGTLLRGHRPSSRGQRLDDRKTGEVKALRWPKRRLSGQAWEPCWRHRCSRVPSSRRRCVFRGLMAGRRGTQPARA